MTETLMHYHHEPFTFDPNYSYAERHIRLDKPTGFWVSVHGEYGWPEWCSSEDYNTEGLQHPYDVALTPTANILRITTLDELIQFSDDYDPGTLPGTTMRWGIDWPRVYNKYDGIIISPYLPEARRYFFVTSGTHLEWYYGWDCASGCIWNLDAIATVTPTTMAIHPLPAYSWGYDAHVGECL